MEYQFIPKTNKRGESMILFSPPNGGGYALFIALLDAGIIATAVTDNFNCDDRGKHLILLRRCTTGRLSGRFAGGI
jgi:hypothetical protein